MNQCDRGDDRRFQICCCPPKRYQRYSNKSLSNKALSNTLEQVTFLQKRQPDMSLSHEKNDERYSNSITHFLTDNE